MSVVFIISPHSVNALFTGANTIYEVRTEHPIILRNKLYLVNSSIIILIYSFVFLFQCVTFTD